MGSTVSVSDIPVLSIVVAAAALAIYVWGHFRRRARRYRSARRFATALINRYGDDAPARARQQLGAAISPREQAFRRAVIEVLSVRENDPAGGALARVAGKARPIASPIPADNEDVPLEFGRYRRRRLSREDLYFLAAVGLAAVGALALIIHG